MGFPVNKPSACIVPARAPAPPRLPPSSLRIFRGSREAARLSRVEAKGAGLVDELGGKQEALGYIERTLKISAEPVLYQHEPTFLEVLSQFAASFNPRVRVSGTQAQLS